MRRIAAGVGMTLLVVAVAVGSADAKTKSFKAKPSGAKCVAKHIEDPSAKLRCSIPGKRGKIVILDRTNKAKIKRTSSRVKLHHASVLKSGQTSTFGAFSCTSASALSCRSNADHGFTVGGGFQLVF